MISNTALNFFLVWSELRPYCGERFCNNLGCLQQYLENEKRTEENVWRSACAVRGSSKSGLEGSELGREKRADGHESRNQTVNCRDRIFIYKAARFGYFPHPMRHTDGCR